MTKYICALDAMVRDFTELGKCSKSEVRRRIEQYAAFQGGTSLAPETRCTKTLDGQRCWLDQGHARKYHDFAADTLPGRLAKALATNRQIYAAFIEPIPHLGLEPHEIADEVTSELVVIMWKILRDRCVEAEAKLAASAQESDIF